MILHSHSDIAQKEALFFFKSKNLFNTSLFFNISNKALHSDALVTHWKGQNL
jgi:hypothetical protein